MTVKLLLNFGRKNRRMSISAITGETKVQLAQRERMEKPRSKKHSAVKFQNFTHGFLRFAWYDTSSLSEGCKEYSFNLMRRLHEAVGFVAKQHRIHVSTTLFTGFGPLRLLFLPITDMTHKISRSKW